MKRRLFHSKFHQSRAARYLDLWLNKGLYLLCLHMHSTAHHREACKLSETRMDKNGLRNDSGVRYNEV